MKKKKKNHSKKGRKMPDLKEKKPPIPFICADTTAGKGKVLTCTMCHEQFPNVVMMTIDGRGFNICQDKCFIEVTQKVLNRFQFLRREGVIGPGELVKA